MTPLTTRRSFLKRATLAGAIFSLGVRCAPAEVAPSASLPYTAQEIAARLGVSMAVYQKERLGARHVAAIRAAGITRIELLMMPQTFDLHDCDQSSVMFVRDGGQRQGAAPILYLFYDHSY